MLGLKLSTKKPKHKRTSHPSYAQIILHENAVEEANEFTYLGSKMATDRDMEPKVHTRLSKVGKTFALLKNVCKSKKISFKTTLIFMNSSILTTQLYRCDS